MIGESVDDGEGDEDAMGVVRCDGSESREAGILLDLSRG